MKSGAHEIAITCTRASDVAIDRASDRIMLDEVPIGSRFQGGEIVGFLAREWTGTLGS
jgi:hypothetical protein